VAFIIRQHAFPDPAVELMKLSQTPIVGLGGDTQLHPTQRVRRLDLVGTAPVARGTTFGCSDLPVI